MDIGDRIKELRTAAKMTQTDLAHKVGISYVQIGRYETKKATPSIGILRKLATSLNTTIDYIANGGSFDLLGELHDRELLDLFKAAQGLGEEDRRVIKVLIDALLTKRTLQEIV